MFLAFKSIEAALYKRGNENTREGSTNNYCILGVTSHTTIIKLWARYEETLNYFLWKIIGKYYLLPPIEATLSKGPSKKLHMGYKRKSVAKGGEGVKSPFHTFLYVYPTSMWKSEILANDYLPVKILLPRSHKLTNCM